MKTDSYIRQRVYLYNTALGNAIMVHLPGEHGDEIIDRYGLPRTIENTITSRNELHERLEQIRARVSSSTTKIASKDSDVLEFLSSTTTMWLRVQLACPVCRAGSGAVALGEELLSSLKSMADVIELNITYT